MRKCQATVGYWLRLSKTKARLSEVTGKYNSSFHSAIRKQIIKISSQKRRKSLRGEQDKGVHDQSLLKA